MGFVSILKAFGKGALTVAGLVQSPFVKAAEGLLPSSFQPYVGDFNKIAAEVATAEAIGEQIKNQLASVPNGGGIDTKILKAEVVLPSVKEIILQASFMSGREIADADRFTAGCRKVMDGLVDILDSVKHKS